jgi:cystathionine beta-synthase
MKYVNHITELIGNTPLVKLNKITNTVPGTILAKLESYNPGHSIKDRIGIKMIEDAERNGKLKKGGTIIESTSGNTGMGLALAAIKKGYKMIATMPDKMSLEKIDILQAMGVEVVVTPTNVTPEDPKSYYSVAKNLEKKIKNSFYVNQYDNLSNRIAHYHGTAPEIWKQTNGKITHLIAGVGTGGTITGCAMFLKEKNENIKIWGVDTYGSVYKKFHETGVFDETEIYSYTTEGIGEDIIPKNVDFTLIDHFEKVTDKDAALMTRKLAREEGILAGNSCGSAVAGLHQLKHKLSKTDIVVIILPDHGSRYIGKIYNDKWMKQQQFI